MARAGIQVSRLRGADISRESWDAFYELYLHTVDDKWGQAYLTRDFFRVLARDMADRVLLVLAHDEGGGVVAGAVNLIGGNCLYGRNWGCRQRYDALHFELCYYQAIEAAIEMQLVRIEAGAQGDHKIARGYLPTLTFSSHFLPNARFRQAVAEALTQERAQVLYTAAVLTLQDSPYKNGAEAHLHSQGIRMQSDAP